MPAMKILTVLLLCLPLAAHAEWGQFDSEFEQDKPWVEVAAQLPPYPKAENLIPFNVSSATRNRYFVDAASISVGSDKVVRYTVVIESAGGAKNVSFEGLRCESGERRLYAYGHPDGTWSKARNAGWEGIKMRSLLSYHKALFEDYFCPDGINVRDDKEAVQNLRRAAR
jgi:CNP1-like family